MKDAKDDKQLKRELETLKKEKQKLNENLEKFRLLYENLPLGYQSLDLQGNFIIVNQAWLNLLGYSNKEEVTGKNFGDFITEKDLFVERFPKFKACGVTQEVIFEMIKKDGSFILISIDGRVSYDKDGNFIQTHCVLHDVTAKHKADESAKKKQYYLAKAQEMGMIGTWELDILKNILIWTDEIYKIFGLPPGTEMNYEIFLNYVHPDDRDYVHEKWSAALKNEPYDIEHRLIVDDKVKWVREKADVEFDTKGNAVKAIGFTQDITERKKAEEKLLVMKTLSEQTNDIIAIKDRNYKYISANPACLEALSKASGDKKIIGNDDYQILPKEMADKLREIDKKIMVNGETIVVEESVGEKTYLSRKFPIKDANNTTVALGLIASEITKRKQAEEKLKVLEKKNRLWLENSPVCTKIVDLDFNLQHMSAAGIKGLKIDNVTKLYGKPFPFDLYPESSRDQTTENLVKVKETGEIITQEISVFDTEGNELWFLSTFLPVNDDEGRIDYIMVVSANITERKQAEEELRQFEHIVSTSKDMMALLDKNYIYLAVNDAYKDRFGMTRDEIVGHSVSEVFGQGLFEKVIKPHAERCLTGEDVTYHDWLEFPVYGKQYMEINYTPYIGLDKEVEGFVVNGRNITDRKKAEDKLKTRADEMSALNAMSIKISSKLDLEQTVDAVLEGLVSLINPDTALLFLKDGEDLIAQGSRFSSEKYVHKEIKSHKIGECMCGLAVTERKPFFSKDIFSDIRCTWDECKKAGMRSFAALPLISGDSAIGVLGVGSASTVDFEERASFFETLAGEVSIALQNAMLYEKVKHHVDEVKLANVTFSAINQLFNEAISCTSSFDSAKICLSIAEEVTGSQYGSIAEVNSNNRFDTLALSDTGWEQCKIAVLDPACIQDMEIRGIWKAALKSKHGLIINDPSSHPESVGIPEGHMPLTSFLGIPFKHKNFTGMIGLANKDGGYSEADREIIESLTLAFAEVINSKRAEEELLNRTEKLERLNKAFVGRELKMKELKEEIEELKKNVKS